ncbi:MAG: alpha-ketoglutarate-dependent dioxygenase AlkB [Paracoccaceae bacterium]
MLPFVETIGGFHIHRSLLSHDAQAAMVEDCRAVMTAAPLMRPVTRWGKPMSVRMTSAGRLGWVIDRGRYRYADLHPEQGTPWPAIPASVLEIWRAVSDWPEDPDSCLVNWYDPDAKMGLHQDKDEGEFRAPVVSISLGCPARLRIGRTERGGPTVSTILDSGDVVVMGGAARLAFHGIDKVLPGDVPHPLTGSGRINLTLRIVRS